MPSTSSNDSSALPEPLFDFDHVKNYVIPKPALCNRIVSFKVGKYTVVGYPVTIADGSYHRNAFVFNFAFVFNYSGHSNVYCSAIRRLARMFMALEEQSKFLSQMKSFETIESILQQIYQDLNNYSECMIPIDESNTVNMKLFHIFPAPPEIKGFDVPISTVQLETMIDVNWDPTMEKIVPFINGINSVRKIAEIADANYNLVKKCIQHLMHYGCIIIIDIFQFSNIYAPTPKLINLLNDPAMMKECRSYIYHPARLFRANRSDKNGGKSQHGQVSTSAPSSSPHSMATSNSSMFPSYGLPFQLASNDVIFYLYASLNQGQTVKEWYHSNKELLKNIDIRRFLTFGVIKELIYRLHSYPILEGVETKDLPVIFQREDLKEITKQLDPPLIPSQVSLSNNESVNRDSSTAPSNLSQRGLQVPQNNSSFSTGTYTSSRNSLGANSNSFSQQYTVTGSSANKFGSSHDANMASDASINSNRHPSVHDLHNRGTFGKHQNVAKEHRKFLIEEMVISVLESPRHFDSICNDMRLSKSQLEYIFKKVGDVKIITS